MVFKEIYLFTYKDDFILDLDFDCKNLCSNAEK